MYCWRVGEPKRRRGNPEVAKRYAAWLQAELHSRDWDQMQLVRQSGLRRQDISAIINGARSEPTAYQIASIARGLGIDPAEVLAAIGLWKREPDMLPPLDSYLRRSAELAPDQIAAVRRTVQAFQAERELRTLREEQETARSADAVEVDVLEQEPQAAYKRRPEDGDEGVPD